MSRTLFTGGEPPVALADAPATPAFAGGLFVAVGRHIDYDKEGRPGRGAARLSTGDVVELRDELTVWLQERGR